MDYIDIKKLYNTIIALYCRVSTRDQDILKQISLAEIYLSKKNININAVKRFIDANVSANKLKVNERPGLVQLLTEIKTGNVNLLLVQARDRLARNFYEYIEIVKVLHQFKVEVIFTEDGHPPFSESLFIEALYGIFPQVNGRTIAQKSAHTLNSYPNTLFGFNTIGQKETRKYIPDPQKVNQLKTFFYDVMDSQTAEDLIESLIKHKRLFKNNHQRALSCLQNPFYAGHYRYQDEYLPLNYVEPIISLEDFLQIQEVLTNCKAILQNSIKVSETIGIHNPICHTCKQPMMLRRTKLGESSYYVCSRKHQKNRIEVSRFNQLIDSHLLDVIKRINIEKVKEDAYSELLKLEKHYKQELAFLQNQLNTAHRNMVSLIGSNKNMEMGSLAQQVKSVKDDMLRLDMLLEKINYSRKEINTFTTIVKRRLSEELEQYQTEYLSKLFFSKIEVSFDALIYHTTFANYIEGNDFLDEY